VQETPDESALGELLSLRQVEARYFASARLVATALSAGVIRGRKVRGAHGKEWRVSVADLERAGYRPRLAAPGPDHADAVELLRAVTALEQALAHSRVELEAARQELSRSVMEIGRLRAENQRLGHEDKDKAL
jgi:hypothetical protein